MDGTVHLIMLVNATYASCAVCICVAGDITHYLALCVAAVKGGRWTVAIKHREMCGECTYWVTWLYR